MILADQTNPVARSFLRELDARLPRDFHEDIVVVVGGDGFFLDSIASRGFHGTFLGLNAGHVGFLLNDVKDWDQVAERLGGRRWTTHTFPILDAKVTLDDGHEVFRRAVNDVYLERATGQMAQLAVEIDGHLVVERLSADGLIFSTALGSTAYTFSAGGPACHPELQIMTVTPICPHRPRLDPFALPATAHVRVKVVHPARRPVRVVADGRNTPGVSEVEVYYGGEQVTLAFLEGHDFTRCMVAKILKP
ncbi:MAG: NAD(+)/NADH kinase [Deltaproteobacteria bacterium]|nr:NAD(+)/NADH kinase [Deltaproteobacteria bacterium]